MMWEKYEGYLFEDEVCESQTSREKYYNKFDGKAIKRKPRQRKHKNTPQSSSASTKDFPLSFHEMKGRFDSKPKIPMSSCTTSAPPGILYVKWTTYSVVFGKDKPTFPDKSIIDTLSDKPVLDTFSNKSILDKVDTTIFLSETFLENNKMKAMNNAENFEREILDEMDRKLHIDKHHLVTGTRAIIRRAIHGATRNVNQRRGGRNIVEKL